MRHMRAAVLIATVVFDSLPPAAAPAIPGLEISQADESVGRPGARLFGFGVD